MLDVLTIIKEYLEDEWTETNPVTTNILWSYDQFDPTWKGNTTISTPIQILLVNMSDKKTWITRNIYKIEHQLLISIYVRPVNCSPTIITSTKEIFVNIKTQIDDILRDKFSISEIYSVDVLGWKDTKMIVGRSPTGKDGEPMFVSEQIIKTIYYEGAYI